MPAGMKGQSIVCFARDWDETRPATTTLCGSWPRTTACCRSIQSPRAAPTSLTRATCPKWAAKLLSFFRGPKHVADGLWVYTPVVLPFPHSALATWINVWILRVGVALIRHRLGIKDFQLWVFLPTAAGYVGKLGESLVVYYVTDEWWKFGYVDMKGVAANDRAVPEGRPRLHHRPPAPGPPPRPQPGSATRPARRRPRRTSPPP